MGVLHCMFYTTKEIFSWLMISSAVTRYSDRTLAMEVIAAQTIQEGEEITISCKL